MEAPATVGNQSEKRPKKEAKLLLGRFEVGKLLGAGTFAKVYVARNMKSDELVAIKALDKEKIIKLGLVAHIKREIAILRRVRHPYVVGYFQPTSRWADPNYRSPIQPEAHPATHSSPV